ncbi:hypothetical protein SCORR_v1c08710 [Spiroplasma corruscae]|uniref:Fido domain-containing protein n=1 Tax=Spiroplasma corruscae TaxID=216934 RepID=A0A222EQX5_9MOLU|nr:Fic family protein [Spiroplasma corruscae]ASP28643.1 hypothetical protein SCORR_v1c08710 [Spiroplasma corruscae]
MQNKDNLYHIEDIEFNIDNFVEKSKIIKEKFKLYNKYMEFCPFDTQYLIMQLLKYEARNSNLIEGIYTSDIDLLTSEDPSSKKITNYLSSLKEAINDYQKNKIYTLDSFLKMHKNLFKNIISTDAINATPGLLRVRNAQIANHNPPKPIYIEEYMKQLINWLNEDSKWDKYPNELKCPIKVAIAHAYFEKIHPFSDGNGRVGRILINLIFNSFNLSNNSYFFISKSILENQFEYYMQLEKLDNNKDYNNWILFFLDLIIEQLDTNIKVIKNSLQLLIKIKNDLLLEDSNLMRNLKNKILKFISRYPIFTITKLKSYIFDNNSEVSDKEFQKAFEDIKDKYNIKKIKDTSFYEFIDVVKIIV